MFFVLFCVPARRMKATKLQAQMDTMQLIRLPHVIRFAMEAVDSRKALAVYAVQYIRRAIKIAGCMPAYDAPFCSGCAA